MAKSEKAQLIAKKLKNLNPLDLKAVLDAAKTDYAGKLKKAREIEASQKSAKIQEILKSPQGKELAKQIKKLIEPLTVKEKIKIQLEIDYSELAEFSGDLVSGFDLTDTTCTISKITGDKGDITAYLKKNSWAVKEIEYAAHDILSEVRHSDRNCSKLLKERNKELAAIVKAIAKLEAQNQLERETLHHDLLKKDLI